jgi:hypothetical protein
MKYFTLLFLTLFSTLSLIANNLELIKNGSFEDGLKHWQIKGQGVLDKSNAAFGKNSYKITLNKPVWQRIFQNVSVQPLTEYVLEYYVKCENIVSKPNVKFYGAASQVLLKKYQPWKGSKGAWKLDNSNSSWQKVSYTFKTGKDDKNISIQFILMNASGTVWFDNISLKKTKANATKSSINATMYPITFLGKAPYKIAENITGTIYLSTNSKLKLSKNEKIELIIDVPSFVKVAGAVPKFAMAKKSKDSNFRITKACKVEEIGKVKRNNKDLRRFKITFLDEFKNYFSSSWYTHYIFFRAEKNNIGKKDFFYAFVKTAKHKSQEISGLLEIIPPITRKSSPCKDFGILFGKLPILNTKDFIDGQEGNRNFWSSMSNKRYTWVRPCDLPIDGFEPIITVGNNFWTVIDSAQPFLREFRKTLTKNITDKGTKRAGYATWSKLDEQNDKILTMYRLGAQEIKRKHPTAKNVVWDFEPHPYGFDPKGRARFAKAVKLNHTPSIEEINTKYRTLWFNYMVKLHAQHINRFVSVFKENAPGINFQLCSDNLYAGENTISAWCGVDVRLSDAIVDGHMHMPYYAGKKFFDDCNFNIKNLQKPFFPLIDPAEALYSFYRQYDANKIKQNIIAVASLGGKGIGFWPTDAFSADYSKAISEAFDIVSKVEDFYTKGKRCDENYSFTPVNVINKIINKNGKKISLSFPNYSSDFRKTAHKYKNDVLFTLFNYHSKEEVIIKISHKNTIKYVAIPANGVKVVLLSEPQNKEVLKKIEDFKSKSNALKLQELKSDTMALEWTSDGNNSPYFLMKNEDCSVGIDLLKEGNIISFTAKNGSNLVENSFLGKLIFYDSLQQPISSKIESLKLDKTGPVLVLKGKVGPYAGANPIPNMLLDMEVYRKYTLKKNTLSCELTFVNPTKRKMTFGFRLNNYPTPGKRFGAKEAISTTKSNNKIVKIAPNNNTFAVKNSQTPFSKNAKIWDHSPIKISTSQGTMVDTMTIIADKNYCGFTSWFGVNYHTIELLTPNVTLLPGKQITFKCDIIINSK